MKINPRDHVAVVGNISSGKSAFVRAILGQILCHYGHVSVHGSFAYCPQVWNLYTSSVVVVLCPSHAWALCAYHIWLVGIILSVLYIVLSMTLSFSTFSLTK